MQPSIHSSDTIVVMFDFSPIDDRDTRCAQVATWIRSHCPEHVEVEQRVWLIVKSQFTVDELFEKMHGQIGAGDCIAMFQVASMMLGGGASDTMLQRFAHVD